MVKGRNAPRQQSILLGGGGEVVTSPCYPTLGPVASVRYAGDGKAGVALQRPDRVEECCVKHLQGALELPQLWHSARAHH